MGDEEAETERQIDTERQRQRDKDRDRQTDRQSHKPASAFGALTMIHKQQKG